MQTENSNLFLTVKEVITQSRARAYRMANSVLLETYWQIGRLMVEDEQQGKPRADYGKAILKNLAQQLTFEFGKGFDYTNLTNMRKSYQAFSILNTLRQELSWSHYRLISRLDSEEKRNYYLTECIENNWNSRMLQRQINSLAFERVLQHPKSIVEKPTIQKLMKDPLHF